MNNRPIPIADQLMDRTMPIPFSGCVVWVGGVSPVGYGKMTYRCKTILAHRASWELAYGKIPEGLFVCHKCDVPSCVNPQHLFLGTPSDNSKDMTAKGRQYRGEKHHFSKLTPAAVRKIRSTKGRTKYLAERYGVSTTAIKKARKGDSWRHA